jgi:hypothetical protein
VIRGSPPATVRPGTVPIEPPPSVGPAGPPPGPVPGPADGQGSLPAAARRELPDWLVEGAFLAVMAAAVFVASLPLRAGYQVPTWAELSVAAAAGSVVVSSVAARVGRLPAPASYALSTIGLVVLLAVVAGRHPAAVVRSVEYGPERLITETLPLSGSPVVLAPGLVMVWLAGAVAAETAIRAPGRRGRVALGVPVLLYAGLYAVTSSAPHRDTLGGPLLVGLLAAAAILRQKKEAAVAPVGVAEVSGDDRPRTPSWARPALAALASATVVAAGLAVAAPHLALLRGRPAGVRRSSPSTNPLFTDPMATMAALRAGPARPELEVTFLGASDGYLGMATFDQYDGAQWRFAATFSPTGGRVPSAPGPPTVDPEVTQRIVITGSLPVPLLPALDRPVGIRGLAVSVDSATGMVLPQALVAHPAYAIESRSPTAVLTQLPPADGLAGSADPSDTELPPNTSADLASTERFLSALTGQRPAPTVAFLQSALSSLQSAEKRIDDSRPSGPAPGASAPTTTSQATPVPPTEAPPDVAGTSLAEVINAVTVNRAATPEQFATFFALAARYLGVPARVVTGFRVSTVAGSGPLAPGSYRVTSRQAWAWVEVPVQGLGWVVCDPTPAATTAAAAPPPAGEQATSTTLASRAATVVPRGAGQGGHALAAPTPFHAAARSPDRAWLLVGLGAAGLAAVLLAAGPGVAAVRRARRRALRRRGPPSYRSAGAWLDLLDGLSRAGLPLPPGTTASEVAAEIGHHFSPDLFRDAVVLAAIADQALFCTQSELPPEAATTAWRLADRLRRGVRGRLDLRQRARAALRVGTAPARPVHRPPARGR